jgi:anti-sigma regulatory factor (Ser/Thr protein kinase)
MVGAVTGDYASWVPTGLSPQSRGFVSGPGSIRAAREWAAAVFAALGLAVSDGDLVISELVTNAVVHGEGKVTVTLTRIAAGVRIAVHDSGPGLVVHRQPSMSAVNGRGIDLVSQVALEFGWIAAADGDGKTVWAVLPAINQDGARGHSA